MEKKDITEILTIAGEMGEFDGAELANTTQISLMDDYANHLVQIGPRAPIVVDGYNVPLFGLRYSG